MNKSPRKIQEQTQIAARRRQVAHFLTLRMNQREIADALHVSPQTIMRDVRAVKKYWLEQSRKDVDVFISRELAELESMDRTAAIKQEDGGWFDRRLRVKERKARLIGLDRQKLEVTGHDGGPIAVLDARSALLAAIVGIINDRGEGDTGESPAD